MTTHIAIALPDDFVDLCEADGLAPETVIREFVTDLTANAPECARHQLALERYERIGFPHPGRGV